MSGRSSSNSVPTKWPSLYRAAISETDQKAFEKRISAAKAAIVARRTELSRRQADFFPEEKERLDDALYILNALKTSPEHCSHR